jgi:hypothetical protein
MFLICLNQGSNPTSTALEASMLTITPPIQFLSFDYLVMVVLLPVAVKNELTLPQYNIVETPP